MNSLFMHITSGNGPEECAFAVIKTLEKIIQEAGEKNITVEVIDTEPSDHPGNARSVLIAIDGADVKAFASSWEGTIRWIWKSVYRPNHKRKNWFAGVYVYDAGEDTRDFNISDVVFKAFRASGPGGQYVNKTDSAVRAIHLPTGKAAVAREARSQAVNKKIALAKLRALFDKDIEKAEEKTIQERWHSHYNLERGNPVRTFRLHIK